MNDQTRQILVANRKAALDSGDADRIADAERAISDALLECQAHSGDRLKRVESRIEKMDTTLDRINLQMTDIATSRAVLTERYGDTTKALKEVQMTIATWKGEAAQKKQQQQQPKTWYQALASPTVMLFILSLLSLLAAIRTNIGHDGFGDVTSAVPGITGVSK